MKLSEKSVGLRLCVGILIGLLTMLLLRQAGSQPVLKIAPLGTNWYSISITNGLSTTNYTLFWTPALGDETWPWQVLGYGSVGQTNFTVDGGAWPILFFRMLVGTDRDGDGVPEWKDGQPLNPGVGILSVTIDSPINGSTFN